ncbi:MAG: hypothetical protein BYD32DRAFT_459166 [Podila humilis]|nr:MAG: hypothetical protein BYD32DRAFT_459166 [Podila humilis]
MESMVLCVGMSDDTDRGLDFQGFESKNYPSTTDLSPHGITDLHRTSWQLYKDFENHAFNRGQFKETAANARRHHLTFMKEIERLDKAGVKVLVDGRIVARCCKSSILWSIGCESWNLDSRDNLEPSTHQLRLYFSCNTKRKSGAFEGPPQSVHLSNHRGGYDLHRPHGFFQIYGPLVDKAIAYLHDLSLPACPSEIGLTRTQSAGIKAYLDVPDGDNEEGNLYRYIVSEQCVFWKCREHVHQHFK